MHFITLWGGQIGCLGSIFCHTSCTWVWCSCPPCPPPRWWPCRCAGCPGGPAPGPATGRSPPAVAWTNHRRVLCSSTNQTIVLCGSTNHSSQCQREYWLKLPDKNFYHHRYGILFTISALQSIILSVHSILNYTLFGPQMTNVFIYWFLIFISQFLLRPPLLFKLW